MEMVKRQELWWWMNVIQSMDVMLNMLDNHHVGIILLMDHQRFGQRLGYQKTIHSMERSASRGMINLHIVSHTQTQFDY
jgi:hypothetical protein